MHVKQTSHSKYLKFIVLVAILVVVTIGGLLVFRYLSNDSKDSQATLRSRTVSAIIKSCDPQHPIVFSHRGSIYDNPEHSFAGYDAAIRDGSAFIEQDVMLSKDGKLFVTHDDNLFRTTGRNIQVSKTSAKQLRTVPLGNGEKLHELADVFKHYGNKIHYIIEAKHNNVVGQNATEVDRQLALAIQKFGQGKNVIVQDSSVEGLKAFHAESGMGTVPLLYLGPASLKSIEQAPSFITFYSMNIAQTTPQLMSAVKQRGFLTDLWTLQEYADNRRAFKDLHPDSVFTNETKITLKYLNRVSE
ncbi:glycerophosphodiester phosphodiesterase [Lacticaseibacillus nasuensis]|uniref:Hydrolase n=1 Tax=Lacticaseibacillus nasuensis JCM 17158 TaxID=1291734 RepID=A0A0R1JKA2_9LACO|nr:glycerophosphodiester phosphodiesterase [Lacticaseibacillus nasuensis]KRK71688.1 hydrolase [Lacticaseibacillus nasuensis JCM 17158]